MTFEIPCVIKEVHVSFETVYSDSFSFFLSNEALNGILNRTGKKYRVGVDYQRLCLRYELCIGSIADPPYSNADFYAHHYTLPQEAQEGNARQLEKLSGIDSAVPVYLWLNDYDANGLLNLLYFSKEFERFENVFLVRWYHTEKDFNGSKFSMIKALKHKTRLSKQDLYDMSARFCEIQKWNAELLVGDSFHIEPWPLSRLEEYVLFCMTERYRYFNSIFSNVCKVIKKATSLQISYHMFQEAVYHLMMLGKIESQGGGDMIITQRFRLPKA